MKSSCEDYKHTDKKIQLATWKAGEKIEIHSFHHINPDYFCSPQLNAEYEENVKAEETSSIPPKWIPVSAVNEDFAPNELDEIKAKLKRISSDRNIWRSLATRETSFLQQNKWFWNSKNLATQYARMADDLSSVPQLLKVLALHHQISAMDPTQEEIFQDTRILLDSVFAGRNLSIFACKSILCVQT